MNKLLLWSEGGCDYRLQVVYQISEGPGAGTENTRNAVATDLLHCLRHALPPEQLASLLEALGREPGAIEARIRKLREQLAHTERLLLAAITEPQAVHADIVKPVVESCWHCHDVLLPSPAPRCESCPDECDVEGCNAPGLRGPAQGMLNVNALALLTSDKFFLA